MIISIISDVWSKYSNINIQNVIPNLSTYIYFKEIYFDYN